MSLWNAMNYSIETFCVGEVDEAGKKLVKVTYDAWQAAIKICKPGVPYSQIGGVIDDIVTKEQPHHLALQEQAEQRSDGPGTCLHHRADGQRGECAEYDVERQLDGNNKRWEEICTVSLALLAFWTELKLLPPRLKTLLVTGGNCKIPPPVPFPRPFSLSAFLEPRVLLLLPSIASPSFPFQSPQGSGAQTLVAIPTAR
eukprot:753233-Hanusia_phi.AAC.1